MAKLGKEEIVTIRVLSERGRSQSSIARELGVTEGAVRYHLRRMASGAVDGRKRKRFAMEDLGLEKAIAAWWTEETERPGAGHPPSVQALYAYLVEEHAYGGGYKAVLRYVRRQYGKPRTRARRRVETPPGAQSQSDWAERWVDLGAPEGPVKLYAFVMVLSHSRRTAVIWSRKQDQLSWHHVHNEAYRRLEGVAAVNRIDNLKTGVAHGAGAWGRVNEQYRLYARQMRFHVDAHQVRQPQQKGKVERRVRVLDELGLGRRSFESLAHLQAWTDAAIEQSDRRRICAATGKTVYETWEAEKPRLGRLPERLPEPFDLVRTCRVHRDCTIRVEGRTYSVPFAYVDRLVEAHGTAQAIEVFDPETGALLVWYPRHTERRILLQADCFEGASTDRVMAPLPLGRMGRKIEEIASLPVEARPIDLYAALAEVSR